MDKLSLMKSPESKELLPFSLEQLLAQPKSEIATILKTSSTSQLHQDPWALCLDAQPVFGAGLTFQISEEALAKGLQDKPLYTKTYLADRPMIFFKSFPHEVVPSGGSIRNKKTAKRMIPETEVVILFNAFAEPVAISIGNDVTAVDLEQENSLYQPYAKYFHGSTSIGPYWRWLEEDMATCSLQLKVTRDSNALAKYEYALENTRRSFTELGKFLFEDRVFPHGVCLFFGCNRSLPESFSLKSGDLVELSGSFLPEPLINHVD